MAKETLTQWVMVRFSNLKSGILKKTIPSPSLQSLVLVIIPKVPNSRSLGLAIINSTTVYGEGLSNSQISLYDMIFIEHSKNVVQ